ncbi:MAG: tetratricopeptide repeat protein, partial [Planctomycetota bacterium]
DAETYFRRGYAHRRLLAMRGDRVHQRRARRDLRKATELAPNEHLYWLVRLSFLARHAPENLEEVYQTARKHNPESQQLLVWHGQLLVEEAREILAAEETTDEQTRRAEQLIERAAEEFTETIEAGHDSPVGHLALARLHLMNDELDQAEAVLNKAREVAPDAAEVYQLLALVHSRRGDTSGELAALRKALENLPSPDEVGVAEQREQVVTRRRQIRNRLAQRLLDLAAGGGENRRALVDEARQHAEALRKLDEDGTLPAALAARLALADNDAARATRILADALERGQIVNRGIVTLLNLYLQREPGKAEQLLRRLPSTPHALALRGLLNIRFRNYEDAGAWISQALTADPDHELAGHLRRAVRVLQDPNPRLAEDFRLIEATRDVLIEALLDRAHTLWIDGRRSAAVALLQDLRAKAPTETSVVSRLLNYYRQMDRPDAAEKLIRHVAEENRGNPAVLRSLASVAVQDPEKRFAMLMQAADELAPLQRHIVKAQVCNTHGRREQFAEHVRRAAEIDAAHPRVVELQFDYALQQEPADWELAERCVRRAEEHDLDEVGGRYYAGRLAGARGNYVQAVALLEEALRKRPSRKQWRMQLAEAYARLGRLDDAEQALRTVAEADPSYAPAVITLARVLRQRNKYQEFQKWALRAARLQPDHPDVRNWRLMLSEDRADDDELDRFIARRREMLKAPSEDWAQADLQNTARLAGLCEQAGRLDDAERYYKLLHRKSPDALSAAAMLGSFYARQGAHDKLDAVMQDLLSAATGSAAKSKAYVLYGQLISNDKPAEAMNAYNAAIDADPDNANAYVGEASLLAAQGKVDEAEHILTRGIARLPDAPLLRYQRAQYRMSRGRLDDAAEDLEAVLDDDPDAIEALRLRAVVARRQDDLQAAMSYLDRALEIAPDNPVLRLQRAEFHLADGAPGAARKDMRAADVGDDPQLMVRMARARLRLDEPQRAARLLREAMRAEGGPTPYEPALRGLIELYHSQRDWQRLGSALNDGIEAYPSSPYYRLQQARMHAGRGRTDRQIDALRAAHELAPKDLGITAAYIDALIDADRPGRALRVIDAYPSAGAPPPVLQAYRARAMIAADRTEEGERLFARLLAEADESQLGEVTAQVRAAYEAPDRAADKLERWGERRGDSARLQVALSELRAAAGQFPYAIEAMQRARKLVETPEQRAEIDYRIGVLHYRAGNFAEAIRYYQAAVEVLPRHIAALNNLAYLLSEADVGPQKLASALEYADRARRLRPDNGNIQDTYGWILAKQGKHREARDALSRAVRLNDENPLLRYHLGRVHEEFGELAQARVQYLRAKELGPDEQLYPKIDKALQRVDESLRAGREQ